MSIHDELRATVNAATKAKLPTIAYNVEGNATFWRTNAEVWAEHIENLATAMAAKHATMQERRAYLTRIEILMRNHDIATQAAEALEKQDEDIVDEG